MHRYLRTNVGQSYLRLNARLSRRILGPPNQVIQNQPFKIIINRQLSTSTKNDRAKLAIEEIYQIKTQSEHILLRPDTYIGSTQVQEQNMWHFNFDTQQMYRKKTKFIPGLYKIFDEILVNAADNKQRDMKNTSEIRIRIDDSDAKNPVISVQNDGKGIKSFLKFVSVFVVCHSLSTRS